MEAATDELPDPGHLARGVAGIAGEDVGRDQRVAVHERPVYVREASSRPSRTRSGSPEDELGHLRARAEAERDERRADAGRDVQRRGRITVDPPILRRERMREQESPSRVGQDDLARVQVAGEDEVVGAGLERPSHARKVAEQDPQVGGWVDMALRVSDPERVRPGIDPDDLDAAASQLDDARFVGEQVGLPQRRVAPPAARTDRGSPRGRGCRAPRTRARVSRAGAAATAPRAACESRSPVMQTRSGSRETTQSTARSAATAPRDGKPRWKSERWATRRPSSSAGRPRSGSSRTRVRSQPASNQP